MSIELLPVSELKELWRQAFGDPDAFIDVFFRLGFSPERCRYLVRDGRVVSALYWFDCQWEDKPLSYIYALATLPDYRGQGLAGELLRQTHHHLAVKGYHGVVLKPAEGLFPYYARQGYATCGHISRFSAEASDTPAPVKELTQAQYAALRRQYLPKNSVIQEGDTLRFLHAFARFWEGPGCVLCTGREEGAVYEYLGSKESAPGVLKSLDIPSAKPIIPGADIPFLMYYPLTCAHENGPAYLGLSLE